MNKTAPYNKYNKVLFSYYKMVRLSFRRYLILEYINP